MNFSDTQIKEALVGGGYIEEAEIAKAETSAKKEGFTLANYLTARELITRDLLGQALAELFGVPYADLNTRIPSIEQVRKVPEKIAQQYRIILFEETEEGIVLATDNPKQDDLSETLIETFPDQNIGLAFSLPEDIDAQLAKYVEDLTVRFQDIIKEDGHVAPELFGEIVRDALRNRASDIHFEPTEEQTVIRFRVDGVLRVVGEISREHYERVLNRMKVESNLRIDEHHTAQDGSMRITEGERIVDLRISVAPTIKGEKVVLRLLAAYIQSFSLGDLGLSDINEELVQKAAKNPFGMMLVAGPTGSGKTTTLYALLRTLNNSEVNITTIEDPVEYRLNGANQIQVNERTGITFARGLRSIVRQDPDVILVGEIRDTETAEIAVNAALTGHLLFSTFHANDAATTIPRLLDMGIEPFLLASTLELVVSQRLVRSICDNCRHSVSLSKKEVKEKFPAVSTRVKGKTIRIYAGKGCAVCNGTGYRGRTGIFEVITVDEALKELILKSPSAEDVRAHVAKSGAKTLFDDGVEKVLEGKTTFEEVFRVAGQPES